MIIEMVDFRPHFVCEWGTQKVSSKTDYDGQPRNMVTFSPHVEYVDAHWCRQVLTSFEIAFVPSTNDEDDALFASFNSELTEALNLCRAPHHWKWQDCVKRPEFQAAEKLVIESPSFKAQFEGNVLLTHDSDFALYRRSLWTKRRELSREQCQLYLDELYRREALHLDRISPEEFFQQLRAESSVREHISETIRNEVWRRDEGKCVQCGSRLRLEFDHIIPVALGGSSTVRNLQLLCESCNRSKGATLGRNGIATAG